MAHRRTPVFPMLLAGAFAALLSGPAAAVTPTAGQVSAAAVTGRIAARDCGRAVDELKSGLKHDYAEVALLAGSMYEHGICVQRDWNRAVLFYSQAYQAGEKEAADRMAAGFAAPENGADVAAALWWATHGRMEVAPGGQVLAPCAVSPAAADDMDRFVAELKTWPQWQLAMCNYVAGVMSTLSGEIKYPGGRQTYGVGGEVMLRFLPALPRIELKKGNSGEYQLLAPEGAGGTGGVEKTIATLADLALRRYPKPNGIPEEAVFAIRFIFEPE